jgi:hypothetical protein
MGSRSVPPSGEQCELCHGQREYGDILLGDWVDELNECDGTRYQLQITEVSRSPAIHGLVRWANWHTVEPMTCSRNAFNTGEGLLRLEPGETRTGSWGIRP